MQTQAPPTYPVLAQAAREARGKDWPEAARLATELRARFPDQPAGYQIGAAAAREMRQFDAAAALQQEGAARFPTQSWPLAEAAWTARAQGDIDMALALTATLRERFPASPTGWQLGARLLRQRNRAAEAAAVLRQAAARFPTADWPARDGAEAATRQARDDRSAALLARLREETRLPTARPDVVGVLGMHRSGTSLCTAILQRLGARLGGPLLPANAFNPEGYQEHAEVVDTHQTLLAALGADWDSPHSPDPVPSAFWTSPAATTARTRLGRLVARETAEAGSWAFKDPRTPRFLPLWRDVLSDRTAAWVLSVRHPAAVAASLAARDGMPASIAGLLWLEHYLEALRHAGDSLSAVVHYEDWFADPLAQARRLAAVLGGAPEEAIRAATATVRADLRHDDVPEPAGLPPLALALHARLRTAGPGEGAALRREAAALWKRLEGMGRAAAPAPERADPAAPERVLRLEGHHEILWPAGSAAVLEYAASGSMLLLSPDPAARLIRVTPCHDGAWGPPRHLPLAEGQARAAVTFGPGEVTLTTGLGTVSLPWSPVAPMCLRCPVEVDLRLILDLEGAVVPVGGREAVVPADEAPSVREPRRRVDLPARTEDAAPWAAMLEQVDPAQGLLGWVAHIDGSAAGLRVEAICRGQRIAHAYTRPSAEGGQPARLRIGWHRFDTTRVARIAAAYPDAPVRLVLTEADGMLRAAFPAPAIAELARRIAAAPPAMADRQERYETIAEAGVFDAAWYRRTYSPSGDPLAHYLEEGEARGYQPCLYLEPWRVAMALGLPSLEGALEAYLRDPLKVPVPGLHFHQAWFRGTWPVSPAVSPALSPGQSPLAAMLANRRNVSPNPFFDLEDWLARNAGLPGVEDPYAHFLAGPDGAAFERRLANAVRWPVPHAVTPGGRVSVILPTYNYARYLHVRLAGIMAQTAPLREVILLDDASSDRSVALAAAMAVQAGWPLRLVVNGRNGGSVVRQWHAGLSRARGEMVWIAEADDLATPALVERLAACLDADPEALFAFCDPAVIDAAGNQVATDNRTYYGRMGDDGLSRSGVFKAADFAVRFLCPRNLVLNASAVLWRRSALERAFAALGEEAFGFTCAGDWRLYVAACGLGGTVHYVAEPLGSHRRHTGSVTSTLEKVRHFAEIQRLHAVLTPLLPDREAGLAAMEQYNRMLRRAWRLPQAAG